ncbi:hypothetical protein IGI43_002534 [Enterococcus sp. AZ126]
MKKNILITLSIIVLVGLIIGGKWYMDREKDKQELLVIQTDLANYLYNNYVLSTIDEEQKKKIFNEFNNGNGDLTESQFFEKLEGMEKKISIESVEFTNFSVTPMNTVRVYFKLNNVYEDSVSLDTVSAENDKLIYNIRTLSGEGPYYLEEKPEKTEASMPSQKIIYYHGTVN